MAPIVTATLSSSSTTRRLPLAMLRGTSYGQCDAERRAAARATSQLDRATVRLDDALTDPQPQSGALLIFGRKERLEDVRQVFLSDALASVANLDVHRVSDQELRVGSARYTRRDRDRPALGHGLLRVVHQVQQHLLDLVGRRDHGR